MATAKATGHEQKAQSSSFLQPHSLHQEAADTSTRPSPSSRTPSWVGPQRSAVTRSDTMAQKVQIQFRQPDLQPPVYIAGSLGESQWEPIEMAFNDKDGEVYFSHEFNAEPGDYQYKFRLGPGDWWVLDESKPIVDDGAGNRNNLLVVEPESTTTTKADDLDESQASLATTATSTTIDQSTDNDNKDEIKATEDADEAPESELNLLRHETKLDTDTKEVEQVNDSNKVEDEEEQPPLLEHEEALFKRVDSKNLTAVETGDSVFVDPAEHEVEADEELNNDYDGGDYGPPLFRHESMSANDGDPEEAPLFRHESMSPLETYSVASHSSASSRKAQVFNTEDVEDPSLEPFPTDEAGILAHLQRTETRLREDETAFEGTPLSPSLAQKRSFDSEAPLIQVRTNESNDLTQLDSIDEREEEPEEPEQSQELSFKAPTEELESAREPVQEDNNVQDVSDTPLAMQPANMSHGPLTPPMTPTEHAHDKASAHHDGPADTPEPELPSKVVRSRAANSTDHVTGRSTPSDESGGHEAKRGLISNLWLRFVNLCGGTTRATGVAFAMSVAAAAFALGSRS